MLFKYLQLPDLSEGDLNVLALEGVARLGKVPQLLRVLLEPVPLDRRRLVVERVDEDGRQVALQVGLVRNTRKVTCDTNFDVCVDVCVFCFVFRHGPLNHGCRILTWELDSPDKMAEFADFHTNRLANRYI